MAVAVWHTYPLLTTSHSNASTEPAVDAIISLKENFQSEGIMAQLPISQTFRPATGLAAIGIAVLLLVLTVADVAHPGPLPEASRRERAAVAPGKAGAAPESIVLSELPDGCTIAAYSPSFRKFAFATCVFSWQEALTKRSATHYLRLDNKSKDLEFHVESLEGWRSITVRLNPAAKKHVLSCKRVQQLPARQGWPGGNLPNATSVIAVDDPVAFTKALRPQTDGEFRGCPPPPS